MASRSTFVGLLYLTFVVHVVLSVNPEGSTGCSKRRIIGLCWRYCSGSAGNWCYTALNCTTDEEFCATRDECAVQCASNSAAGCVNSCDDNEVESDFGVTRDRRQEMPNVGLSDLSFKDALDTIAAQLNDVQDKLAGSMSNVQERNIPHLQLLGRIGTKVYYRSLGLKLTWVEGLNFCHSNALEMATIDSAVEQQALQSFMTLAKLNDPSTDPQYRYFWIGGMRIPSGSNDFYWMNSGRKFGYTNWDQGQPNNPDTQFCVVAWKDSQKWNNLPCTNQFPVICEKDLLAIGI